MWDHEIPFVYSWSQVAADEKSEIKTQKPN
jgi:hypothetical protein